MASRQPTSSSTEARQLLVLEWEVFKLAQSLPLRLDCAKSKSSTPSLILDFFGSGSGLGGEIESCTTLFARRANAPIHTSVVPNTAGDE